MISVLKEQLAIDLNGGKEDFEREENVVKILSPNPSKRRNINDELLLFMACFGKATVAAVRPELEAFMTTYIADMDGFRCFDMPLNVLEKENIFSVVKVSALVSVLNNLKLLKFLMVLLMFH